MKYMNSQNSGDEAATPKSKFEWDDHFFGAVTVGERGQVVIPAEARKRFDISPGDKLLIMGDPGKHSIMLCKIGSLKDFMTRFQEGLARVEKDIADDSSEVVSPAEEDSNQ